MNKTELKNLAASVRSAEAGAAALESDLLRALREVAGSREASSLLGVSHAEITRLRRGTLSASRERLIALAERAAENLDVKKISERPKKTSK